MLFANVILHSQVHFKRRYNWWKSIILSVSWHSGNSRCCDISWHGFRVLRSESPFNETIRTPPYSPDFWVAKLASSSITFAEPQQSSSFGYSFPSVVICWARVWWASNFPAVLNWNATCSTHPRKVLSARAVNSGAERAPISCSFSWAYSELYRIEQMFLLLDCIKFWYTHTLRFQISTTKIRIFSMRATCWQV